ncbi:hypothetical protein [Chitinophaga dinghuensis]|nr:hypothetical protein [Chitinophaga dinghuensis]
MKHYLVILGLTTVLFASSCSKKNTSLAPEKIPSVQGTKDPIVDHGRLFFSSQADYVEFIKRNFRKKMQDQLGFISLNSTLRSLSDKVPVSAEIKDLRDFGFPAELLSILNEHGEMRIGNDIIWYHNGKKYYIPVVDEERLSVIKEQPGLIAQSFDARQIKLQTTDPNGKSDLGLTATDSRYIKEFFLWGNVHTRFVHEVTGFIENTNVGTWIAYSVIRLKLEWKDCCKWNPATSMRDISVNLTGSANLYNGTGTLPTNGFYIMGPSVAINETDVSNSDYVLTLAAVEGRGSLLSGSHWTLRLDGSIYQYAQNDYLTNAWTNTGTPLW